MKKSSNQPNILTSIAEIRQLLGLSTSQHPLISVVNYDEITVGNSDLSSSFILNLYKISLKINFRGKIRYGQSYYDLNQDGLSFISLNQVIWTCKSETTHSGYTLLIHPDFLKGYPLAKSIKEYSFFSYSITDSLRLSRKEVEIIASIIKNIEHEFSLIKDDTSHDLIIAYIELLLKYCDRFYKRQFNDKKINKDDLLVRLEDLLSEYLNSDKAIKHGFPTVQYISDKLYISPGYLSEILRAITGQNAKQHIHNKMVEKAKELLSTNCISVSEVSSRLGFEHAQSFSKFFKNKTGFSPSEFKDSFK